MIQGDKISCIVSVYNRFSYLRNVIVCLQRQTLQIDELIIADDGSSENLEKYIVDLLDECKFSIKHVRQDDLGFRLARSRNNAVRVSEGDFLIFFDQDLIFDDNFIKNVYLQKQDKTLLARNALLTNEDEKNIIQNMLDANISFEKLVKEIPLQKIKLLKKREIKNELYNVLYKFKLRHIGMKMVGYFFALNKSDFLAIEGFDESYVGWGEEDDDFYTRFVRGGGGRLLKFFLLTLLCIYFMKNIKAKKIATI